MIATGRVIESDERLTILAVNDQCR
jgi:hypothetical protein